MTLPEKKLNSFFKVFNTILSCTHQGQLKTAENFIYRYQHYYDIPVTDGYVQTLIWTLNKKKEFYQNFVI